MNMLNKNWGHLIISMPHNPCTIGDTKLYFNYTLGEESSQTNVILQYKLLVSILSAVCSVIQQS